MFDPEIIEILKQANRRHRPTSGEPIMLKGGIRTRMHPLPAMDFQPDTLATGDEMYSPSPRRLVGAGKGLRDMSRVSGIEITRGGSLKSVGRSFKKGLKSVGKVVMPIAKDVGKTVIREATPIVKDIASKYTRDQLAKFLTKEALPVAEETAPLLLAAGRRQVSDKMKRRAMLVKKIMREHGMSLPEASRYVKEQGMKY
jgi:hypothetical protein